MIIGQFLSIIRQGLLVTMCCMCVCVGMWCRLYNVLICINTDHNMQYRYIVIAQHPEMHSQ